MISTSYHVPLTLDSPEFRIEVAGFARLWSPLFLWRLQKLLFGRFFRLSVTTLLPAASEQHFFIRYLPTSQPVKPVGNMLEISGMPEAIETSRLAREQVAKHLH